MRRLELIEFVERWSTGGIESYIAQLVSHLDPQRYRVRVLAIQRDAELYDEKLAAAGCELHILSEEAFSNPFQRELRSQQLFRDYIQKNPCDVLHLHIFHGLALRYAMLAKRAGVKRVLVHSHNSGFKPEHYRLKLAVHRLGRLAYLRSADVRLACSDVAARWLFGEGRLEGVHYCKCFVDTDRFRFSPGDRRELRARYGLTDETVYLSAGRIEYQKNPMFLLEIFAELARMDGRCRLVWIGGGDLRDAVRERARALGLDGCILFVESTLEIWKYMSMADAFLLPSRFEGNPIVAAEAQASGLPCYLSDAVTRQAGLLKSTRFLPLRESPRAWAREICAAGKGGEAERAACADAVRACGYDVAAQLAEMEALYGGEPPAQR